jgi:hypothetical protein
MSGSVASSSRSSATLSSTSHPTPASSATSVSVSAPSSAAGSSKGKGKAVMRPPALHSPSPAESLISARPMRALPSRARKAPPTPKLLR